MLFIPANASVSLHVAFALMQSIIDSLNPVYAWFADRNSRYPMAQIINGDTTNDNLLVMFLSLDFMINIDEITAKPAHVNRDDSILVKNDSDIAALHKKRFFW